MWLVVNWQLSLAQRVIPGWKILHMIKSLSWETCMNVMWSNERERLLPTYNSHCYPTGTWLTWEKNSLGVVCPWYLKVKLFGNVPSVFYNVYTAAWLLCARNNSLPIWDPWLVSQWRPILECFFHTWSCFFSQLIHNWLMGVYLCGFDSREFHKIQFIRNGFRLKGHFVWHTVHVYGQSFSRFCTLLIFTFVFGEASHYLSTVNLCHGLNFTHFSVSWSHKSIHQKRKTRLFNHS